MRGSILIVLLLVFACAACQGDGSKLAVGDIIGVTVDGEQEFTKAYQIDSLGSITLPMLGPVNVLGQNTSEASATITKSLTSVLVSPQVTVVFVERAKMQVFVVGQVKKPGPQDVGVGDHVVQALAQAGYDDTTDLSHINIRRGDQIIDLDITKYLSGEDLSMNAKLESGDTVVAPRVDMIGTVLVLGQVTKIGSVPLKRGMTFREVMGFIGGVTVEADTENITVKRKSASELVKIDYKRAMDGDPTADVALQPGDTVYVPQIETAFFTVMGGVNRPGQYPLKGKLTLSEAIGVAGGPAPSYGDMKKVQLTRAATPGSSGCETLNIDLTAMRTSGKPEPIINRGDVIQVGIHKEKPGFLDVIRSIMPFGWIFR